MGVCRDQSLRAQTISVTGIEVVPNAFLTVLEVFKSSPAETLFASSLT